MLLNVLRYQLHLLISHMQQIQKLLLKLLQLILSYFLPPRFIFVTSIRKNSPFVTIELPYTYLPEW